MHKLIVDIWGGYHSQEHVARYILDWEEALELMSFELSLGYLINIRNEVNWQSYKSFDERKCTQ